MIPQENEKSPAIARLFCFGKSSADVVERLIVRDGFQIFLHIAFRDQLHISSWIIVDQPVQFGALLRGFCVHLLCGGTVNGKNLSIPQPRLHAAGVHVELTKVHFHCSDASFVFVNQSKSSCNFSLKQYSMGVKKLQGWKCKF